MKKLILGVIALLILLSGMNEVDAKGKPKYEGQAQAACEMYNVCHREARIVPMRATSKNILQDLTYYDLYETSRKRLKVGAYYNVVYVGEFPKKAFIRDGNKTLNNRYNRIKQQQKRYKYRYERVTFYSIK